MSEAVATAYTAFFLIVIPALLGAIGAACWILASWSERRHIQSALDRHRADMRLIAQARAERQWLSDFNARQRSKDTKP